MTSEQDVTLRWLGAAHFQLTLGHLKVVTDPLYSRLPGERPQLEESRDRLDGIDAILLTHGHLDHSADVPYLAGRYDAEVLAPQEILDDLVKVGARTDQSRCLALESIKGRPYRLGNMEVTPYQIGTEQIDFWFIRSMFVRPWRHGRPQAIPAGLRWLRHHLFCNCFAFHLRLPEGVTLLFFGNLTPNVEELAAVDSVDVLAIPYCPANCKWQQQTLQLITRFRPAVTLVHHFDNFMHPFTVSRYMDLGRYRETILAHCPDARLFFAKFGQKVALSHILAARSDPPPS